MGFHDLKIVSDDQDNVFWLSLSSVDEGLLTKFSAFVGVFTNQFFQIIFLCTVAVFLKLTAAGVNWESVIEREGSFILCTVKCHIFIEKIS